jgi:outer membrane protein OmpA-like peptidoglycan-associated protein
MKLFLTVLFLMSSAFSLKAQDILKLKGSTKDARYKVIVPYVLIKMTGDDGHVSKACSDSMGHYELDVRSGISYAIEALPGDSSRGKSSTFGECPNSYYGKHGYLKSEKVFIKITDRITVKDFYLDPIVGYDVFPTQLCFRKNSVEFLEPNRDSLKAMEALDCFVAYSTAHPDCTFEIGGHAGTKEKKRKELSMKRADHVITILISKGVDPRRLRPKYYGSDVSVKSSEHEQFRHIPDSRITFKVLRRDFGMESITNDEE